MLNLDDPGARFDSYDNEDRVDRLRRALPTNTSYIAGLDELAAIAKISSSAGYGRDQISIDPSVVRGLEYYTGPVYEVELTFEIKDDKGRPVRFGSVGGGGRYDGLVSRFMGQPVPATGFSIGVSRLQAALTALGKLGDKAPAGPVLVTVFGADSIQAGQALTAKLRNAGIRAELYLGNPKHGIGQQLKYADKRGSPCAVIQGPDEKAKGEVLIEEPLKALEDEFEGRFVRIHRNCLVALTKLAGLTRAPDGRLLANVEGVTAELEVSRRNLPVLRKLVRTL
jgi:histidyl-tRNA synthetase